MEALEWKSEAPGPFMEIVWLDTMSSGHGWCTEADLPEVVTVSTRGWLAKETELSITLVGSFYMHGGAWTFGEAIAIPRCCFVSSRNMEV